MKAKNTVLFEVIRGSEGLSLYVGDENGGYRLAGPKPWGGGHLLHYFTVDADELMREVRSLGARPEELVVLDEWFEKTNFIQEWLQSGKLSAKYLGMHRADIMRDLIEKAAHVHPIDTSSERVDEPEKCVHDGAAEEAEHFIQAAIDRSPEPLRRLGRYLANVLDEDQWKIAERMLLGAAERQSGGDAIPLNVIRQWPDGFSARLDEVWKDLVGFIPNYKLHDLQRVLAEFGFTMTITEDRAAPEPMA